MGRSFAYSHERPGGVWHVYELPHPDVGHYIPAEVVTSETIADVVATIAKPDFDPMKHVVISTALRDRLVLARDNAALLDSRQPA